MINLNFTANTPTHLPTPTHIVSLPFFVLFFLFQQRDVRERESRESKQVLTERKETVIGGKESENHALLLTAQIVSSFLHFQLLIPLLYIKYTTRSC